jgi:hypothetical protein
VVNEDVLEEIQRELKRRPGITPGVLFQLAVLLDRSLEALNLRQFHTLYILPAKQRLTSENRSAMSRSRVRGRRGAAGRGRGVTRPPSAAAEGRGAAAPRDQIAAEPPVSEPEPEPTVVATAAAVEPPPPPAGEPAEPAMLTPPDRRAVRAALMGFALELAAARTSADLVAVFAGLDRHVDRALAAG